MRLVRRLAFLVPACVLVLAAHAVAQSTAPAAASDDIGCRQRCYRVALPLGLYVQQVIDDGRYVMLEDGSVWEIRLNQRPVASGWREGDFVQLRTIWAPVDHYEVLLARGDADRAEARLAGRGQAPVSEWPD